MLNPFAFGIQQQQAPQASDPWEGWFPPGLSSSVPWYDRLPLDRQEAIGTYPWGQLFEDLLRWQRIHGNRVEF